VPISVLEHQVYINLDGEIESDFIDQISNPTKSADLTEKDAIFDIG